MNLCAESTVNWFERWTRLAESRALSKQTLATSAATWGPPFDLPHDEVLESALIGSLQVEPDTIRALKFLRPEHFYSESHRRIFEAMQAVVVRDGAFDVTLLIHELMRNDWLVAIGGVSKVSRTVDGVEALGRQALYAAKVVELWRKRELISRLHSALIRACGDGTVDADELAAECIDACVQIVPAVAPASREEP